MECICCNPNLKLVVTASGRLLSAISLNHLGSTQLYLSYLLSTSDVEYLDEMQVMGKKDKKCSPPAFINTLACVSVKKVFYPSRLIGSSRHGLISSASNPCTDVFFSLNPTRIQASNTQCRRNKPINSVQHEPLQKVDLIKKRTDIRY